MNTWQAYEKKLPGHICNFNEGTSIAAMASKKLRPTRTKSNFSKHRRRIRLRMVKNIPSV